jgi:hypothetical protein
MSKTRRPSTLTSFSVPVAGSWLVAKAIAPAAVEIQGRSASFVEVHSASGISSKINYMGYANALGDGAATSNVLVSAAQRRQVQVDKATGGNARGIPPRGRPV